MPSPIVTDYSPEQAVKDYYQLINQRRYEEAWARLSTGFQQRASNNDYNDYVEWWDSVASVEVGEVRTVTSSDSTATVLAQLRYFMKDGRIVNDYNTRIQLVRDTTSGIWLFDGKGP